MDSTSDKSREELARKLDSQLDDFVDSLKSKEFVYKDGWKEDTWEEDFEKHPAFRSKPFEVGEELPAEFQALQDLKYGEGAEPEGKAESYRSDGNENFRLKKYRWAVEAYSEGLKVRCENDELNAVLHTNRAAAHFRLGNFRSSLNDAIAARRLKPRHMKAIVKGAECCLQLHLFDEALSWCDAGLWLESGNAKLLEMAAQARKKRSVSQRNERKRETESRKKEEKDVELLQLIKEKGVKMSIGKHVASADCSDAQLLSCLESRNTTGARVHKCEKTGVLHWPVMFLYPEFGTTDFIKAFGDSSCFEEHLEVMHGAAVEARSWDGKRDYTPASISIYFEDCTSMLLYAVDKRKSLSEVLRHERYTVVDGIPSFLLLVEDSKFGRHFLSQYRQPS